MESEDIRTKYEKLAEFLNELGVETDDDKDLVIPVKEPKHYVSYTDLGGWVVNGE